MYCSLEDLDTESDVEKKFIEPLLTTPIDRGLGYLPHDYKTNVDIRRLRIGKGSDEKLYRPDYVIIIAGVPVVIIEAKAPGEDCQSALREARLYAHELNSKFPTGVNPCRRVVATNALSLLTSPADADAADLELNFSDFSVTSLKFNALLKLLSRESSQKWADNLVGSLTARPLERAIALVGGQSVRDADIGYNDFGSKLALDYRHIFTPESAKDRAHVVHNAYVPSQRREHFVDEVDRIIKTAVVSTVPGSRLIENTGAPNEIVAALRKGRKLENEIMLLVGARGSGKTTFVDYCRLVKLPQEILDETVWAHINCNESPKSKSELERWALAELCSAMRAEHPTIEFLDDPDVVERVYAVELRRLKTITLKNLAPGTEAFETRVADHLLTLQQDPLLTAKATARFLCGERGSQGKLLIVVFDNADKRDREEQLAAFEVARWLQGQIPCLVILPIRDVTYELCKDELPLDSTIKDLVFRIDPPPFAKVLSKRIDLVLYDLRVKSGSATLDFTLDNGHKVTYPATELGYYLASVFKSLYEYDRLVRSLLLGLAGRNMRKAMEIFLEFCRSGHIGPAQIWQIKAARGHYSLPYEVVTNVLLRRNRRFYDGDQSFVKNLFQCDPSDAKPDSFVRVSILDWLLLRRGDRGPSGTRGFFRYADVAAALIPLGHDANRVRLETQYLIKHGCILTEHQHPELRSEADLLRLSPSGYVHLKIMNDPAYASACAEETWVTDRTLANDIATRIAHFGPKAHYSPVTTMLNAKEFVRYLLVRSLAEVANPEVYLESVAGDARKAVEQTAAALDRAYRTFRDSGTWDELDARFHQGMECDASVSGIQEYGLFMKLDGGPTGLLHVSEAPTGVDLAQVRQSERIRVQIKRIDREARKIRLGFVRFLGAGE